MKVSGFLIFTRIPEQFGIVTYNLSPIRYVYESFPFSYL